MLALKGATTASGEFELRIWERRRSMKVAFTADLHLTTRESHPERYTVLERILQQCGELEMDLLVVAGDLFDQTLQNFGDFEDVYLGARPGGLQTVVIPGNHDPDLRSQALAAEGLAVVDDVHPLPVGSEMPLLLVPYVKGKTMGEAVAPFEDQLPEDRWVLAGHGDWAAGLRIPNPYEPGVYMPLTRQDLQAYQPAQVFLGHIHRPFDDGQVHYPGSPCPLDINETGLRRLLVFDTDTREVREERVDSPVLYFNESFVMLPVEDEERYLREELRSRMEAWGLPEGWQGRVQLRVRVSGYTTNRNQVAQIIEEAFDEFDFYDETGPDLSDLNHTSDLDRDHIAREVRTWIEALEWSGGPTEPAKDEILTEALKAIYGA